MYISVKCFHLNLPLNSKSAKMDTWLAALFFLKSYNQ